MKTQKGFSITISGYATYDPNENSTPTLEAAVKELMAKYQDELQEMLNSYGSLGVDSSLSNFVITGHSKEDYPKIE